MWDYPETSENLIVTINIPWDAKTEDEHTYYFWKPNPPFTNIIHDTFTRQTREDGSLVLIPED
jgi:hypothetical protein